MTQTDIAMPALDAVAAALRKATETLAGELACPTEDAPDWSECEWLIGRAVASLHGVSPLLSGALRWQGPAGWSRFLGEQRVHTAQRYRRIEDLLGLIDRRARGDGIPLVGLKGTALHAIGIYQAGERPMADVDLLVRDEDVERTARMLEALGFRETLETWKHRVFEPSQFRVAASFGEHCDNGIKIELHSRIRETLPLHAVEMTQLVWPRLPHAGLNGYRSPAALLSHLVLHAAGAMAFRWLRLLQLHDIARLSARMTDADWDEFLTSAAPHGGAPWWAFPPLALTARYYSSIPQRVLVATASTCPWLVKEVCRRRSLSDGSISYLWTSAFPGIEWARSLREMLAYAKLRVVPSPQVLAEREYAAATSPAAAASTWSSLSQGRRILRWVTARPPRVDTLFAVRSALASAP
jgi:hypothetical protein